MQSLQFLILGKVSGIERGLDAVLPFTCYSYWFSGYFDQRGKSMKALPKCLSLKKIHFAPQILISTGKCFSMQMDMSICLLKSINYFI
jgi:hypothetical protein